MAGTELTPQMRSLQNKFETRRLADRVLQVAFHEKLTETDRAMIENAMFFFLATVDGDGQPQCSYKGGPRGFVTVEDDGTLVFPVYEGNGLYISAGNVAEVGKVGLLFIDFEAQKRMRINGVAENIEDHPAYVSVRAAQLAIRVRITDIHPNCPRNVHKMTLVEQSRYTPKCEADDVGKAPWGESFADVLPENMKPEHFRKSSN